MDIKIYYFKLTIGIEEEIVNCVIMVVIQINHTTIQSPSL